MNTLTHKMQNALSQWFGIFILTGMAIAFIGMAGAFDAYFPQLQPTGYVAQGEMSNFDLTSGIETVYQTDYKRDNWSGNLHAYPVSASGVMNGSTERWAGGAAFQIDLQNYDTGRLIATMSDAGAKVAFRYASLSLTQQALFPTTTINLLSATGTSIVNFLRGDRTNEGAQSLRIRESVLGDIIHSRPYYIADTSYPSLFVGANDGMLHVINTVNGQERWAYVPSMLLSKMLKLAKPYGGLTTPHDYFVDGQINIAKISSGAKRILVGSLGGGGKGLYALDITGSAGLDATTEAMVAGKIKWEITPTTVNNVASSSYDNLGYTYGTPLIGKLGSTDVVIIGNGYNDAGNYKSYLYVIDADTGAFLKKFPAGTGTAASPNGLFNPVAVTNADGTLKYVYAGDLNGTMWKFNPNSNNGTQATALLVTSPPQPITSNPGVGLGPNNVGYMINFATGSMFTDAENDTATYYAYGIWDGAPAGNTTLLTQTLEERTYGTATRARKVTNNLSDWSVYKGWKVALPAGERVVGEGSFIESGRFYFTGTNPTKFINMPDPCVAPSCANQTEVFGENWLMELDYLSGGAKNSPFLDMNGDLLLNNNDRFKYTTADSRPLGVNVGDPILNATGIPVGKFLTYGAQSQPILVQLNKLNTTLFNQNPDAIYPFNNAEFGVSGGHFDVDFYYGAPICADGVAGGGAKAFATITVGSTGNTRPATLGGISVDGVSIVSALTAADLVNGTDNATNTAKILSKLVAASGYTATLLGNILTFTAPVAGTAYNGKTFTISPGTTQAAFDTAGTVGVRPTALLNFSGTGTANGAMIDNSISVGRGHASVTLAGKSVYANDIINGDKKTAIVAAAAVVTAIGTGGATKAYVGGNAITPTCAAKTSSSVCLVDNSTYTNGSIVALGTLTNFTGLTVTLVNTAGGVAASAVTHDPGWDALGGYLVTTSFGGGTAAGLVYAKCSSTKHVHQFDDKYDKTGVDMLNSTVPEFDLSDAITNTGTKFKVIAQNQYLNPAVELNLHYTTYTPTYLYNVAGAAGGYLSIKNFVTMANLNADQATMDGLLPMYTRTTLRSLAFNMPIDALTAKNWWGNGDIRAGLHPTQTGCVKSSASVNDSNMYQPVIPPANGVDGPGTAGWSLSTTPLTATGARHNGALTIQIIKDTTPYTSIELNVTGRPEYGWRVKAADYATYVLAEYTTFWHHKNKFCYGDVGWTKTPGADPTSTTPLATLAGTTDPKVGDLSGNGATLTGMTSTTYSGSNLTSALISSTNLAGLHDINSGAHAYANIVSITQVIMTYGTATAKIIKTTYVDGSTVFQTLDTSNNNTRMDIENKTKGDLINDGGLSGISQSRSSETTGRISWHELFR